MADQFTPKQQAIVDAHFAEAMRVGTCTDPADRATTEACITQMYAEMRRARPAFFWADGPLAAVRAIAKREPAYRDTLPPSFSGGENAYWVYHYLAGTALGARYDAKRAALLDLWRRLCGASGWWFPFEHVVVCAERPRTVSLDDRRVLHSETGPAAEWRDGHRIYAWHGTRVPAEWIENRAALAPTIALTWPNIEQRRAAAEIIGWARVLDQLPHTVIDRDADPEIGTLIEVALPDAGLTKFLLVRCPTGRDFALVADLDAKTALDANAASYGLKPADFRLEVRG